ncbi:hypothetical protein [Kribbella jiaozuonensis]
MSAEGPLQEAGAALRQAVEVLRHRPSHDVAAKMLVAEFHELRSLMSSATLLMRSFGVSDFAEVMHAQAEGDRANRLAEAEAGLKAASTIWASVDSAHIP